MFSIDEDELDIDLDDEDFLLEACGIVPSSDYSSNIPSVGTSNSRNDTPLQTTPVGFTRKPFSSLENSATLSRESTTLLKSPGNHINPPKPAGPANINNISSRCMNNNNFNKRTGLQECEPPAKRLASSTNNLSFAPKQYCNSNKPRTSSSFSNLHDIKYTNKKDCSSQNRQSKDVNSPRSFNVQGLNGKKIQSFTSPGDNSCLNPTCRSPFLNSNFKTLSDSNHNNKNMKNMTPRGRQMDRITSSNADTFCTDITPLHKKSSRKFPGPAGLLPKLNIGQNLEELSTKLSPLPSTSRQSPVNQQPVSSQLPSEDEEFTRDPWISMFNEYQENVPSMMRYSIVQVMSEAACQRLRYGKVSSLCAIVKTFSPTETDSSIFLKDPTGEIYGTLHKRVLEEYQTELGPGAGIILKQVSVFSPSPRKHYLNITPGNIVEIYPPDPSHLNSSQLLASQGTQDVTNSSKRSYLKAIRSAIEEPELIVLEPLTKTPDKEQNKETSQGNSENFDELLEGLDNDDILDEDLLAMY